MLRFAIEAECLAGDVGEAQHLLFAHLGIMAGLFIERGMVAQEKEGVADGLKRVIDFVGDDACDAAHGGQPLGFSQCIFRLQLSGDVAVDLEDGIALRLQRQPAGDHQFVAIASHLGQVSVPTAGGCQRRFNALIGHGEASLQDVVNGLAEHFVTLPAVELLRARVPEEQQTIEVADDDGLSCEFEQVRAFAEQIFQPLATGYIEECAHRTAHGAGGIAKRAGAGQQIGGRSATVTNLQLHAAKLLPGGCGSLERKLFRSQQLVILIEAEGVRVRACPIQRDVLSELHAQHLVQSGVASDGVA